MSNSKIQMILDSEAVQATIQQRRAKHAAWIQREARRKNGGLSHAVRFDIRSENKHAVKSAEANGEWVSMTSDGKVAGIKCRGKRRGKNPHHGNTSGKVSYRASKFASLDMGSDDETEHETEHETHHNIKDIIIPIRKNYSQTEHTNTWAAIAMTRLPTNQVEQKWDKVEKSTHAPSSITVSDFVPNASANMCTNNDAWEDSDDETEVVSYPTLVKKSWADMMDESDEEDD